MFVLPRLDRIWCRAAFVLRAIEHVSRREMQPWKKRCIVTHDPWSVTYRADYFQGAEEHVGRNTCRCFSVNRSKRGKREATTRGKRGKVDEGWVGSRKKQDFGIQGHATHAFTYFWTSRFLERHGSIEGGSRTHASLFSFDQILSQNASPNSSPYIEWKYVEKLHEYFFSLSLCSFFFLRFALLLLLSFVVTRIIDDSRINFIIYIFRGIICFVIKKKKKTLR